MSYLVDKKIAPKHVKLAFGYLRRAAKQGDPLAQNTLGFRIWQGDEGKPDLVEAYMWLMLASRKGEPNAKVNLERLSPTMKAAQIDKATRRADEFRPRREAAEGILLPPNEPDAPKRKSGSNK